MLYDENASDSHMMAGSKSAERVQALPQLGIRFAVADGEFVRQQAEGAFDRQRARAQGMLQK